MKSPTPAAPRLRPARIEAIAYLVKDRTAPRDARQHVIQGSGVRTGPTEGPARLERCAGRRSWGWLRPADVKARVNVSAPVWRAGEQPPRRGRSEPDAGACRGSRASPTIAFRSAKLARAVSGSARRGRHRRQAATPSSTLDLQAFRRSRLPPQHSGARLRGRRRTQRRARRTARSCRTRRTWSASSPTATSTFVQRGSARRAAQWLAVNQQLNPVAADSLTLEWVQRKFVSVLTQQGNGTFSYVSRLKEIVRDTPNRAESLRRQPLPAADAGARRFRAGAAQRRRARAQPTELQRRRRRPTCRDRSSATPSCRFSSTSRLQRRRHDRSQHSRAATSAPG